MSLRAHPVRRPFLLSLALHGLAGLVLAAAAGTGALGRKPLERLDVSLAREVEAEPEAPPPPEAPLPRVREPGEVALEEEAPPAESDPREAALPDGATSNDAWETRGGAIGLGGGRAPRIGRRPGAAIPSPAPPPPAAEPGPAPAPAGPSVRARPLPAECRAPVYPEREKRLGTEGVVTLLVSIDAAGVVEGATVEESSGSAALDAAALRAVRRWRFEPALQEGRPVPDVVLQTVRFRIETRLASREGR